MYYAVERKRERSYLRTTYLGCQVRLTKPVGLCPGDKVNVDSELFKSQSILDLLRYMGYSIM